MRSRKKQTFKRTCLSSVPAWAQMDRAGPGDQHFTTHRTLTGIFGKILSGEILPAWAEGERGRLTWEESIEPPTFHWQGRPCKPWAASVQAWTGGMTSKVQRKASGYEIPGGWFAGLGTWVCQLGFQNCYDFLIFHLYWHFTVQISECLLPVCWMWTVLRIGHFPFGFESGRERGTKLKKLHWKTIEGQPQGLIHRDWTQMVTEF